MVRKADTVSRIIGGDKSGRVKNIVDAERRKFADIGISQTVPSLQETVRELCADGIICIGKRGVVEITAQNYFVGRPGDVFPQQKSLTGSGFIGADDMGKDIPDALRKIMCRPVGNFFDKFPLFVTEPVRFEVDIINPDSIFSFQNVTVLCRTGMAFVKSDSSCMENGQAGKYSSLCWEWWG